MFPLLLQLTTIPLAIEMTPRLMRRSQNLSWSLLVKTKVATKAWPTTFDKKIYFGRRYVISSFNPPHWLLFKCSHGVFLHKSIKDKADLLIVEILSNLLISYVFDLPSLVPSWNKRVLNYVVSNISRFVDKNVVKNKNILLFIMTTFML